MTSTIAFISYPKSGRTWMRYVFHLIGRQVDFTHAGHGTSLAEIGAPFAGVKTSALKERNIFMFRNPLDTAVSLYFQVHKKDFRPFSHHYLRKFLKLAAAGRLPPKDINEFVADPVWGVENICCFNRAWLDHFAARGSGLVISYEQARANPEDAIRRICDHCDVPSYDAAELARASSFESMKALEFQGRSKELMLHGFAGQDPEAMKVRRGVVGGYSDYLASEIIEGAKRVCSQFEFAV